MKKIIAMLLAIVMVCALSVSVFAAPTTDDATSAPVKGTYSQADHDATAYVIDITWGAMSCTWTIGAKEWNTDSHTWTDPEEGGAWSYEGNTIEVVNNSSVGITVGAAYAATIGYEDISGTIKAGDDVVTNDAPAELAKPADGVETSVTLTLTLSGALAEGTEAGTTIGNITLELKDLADAA